MALFNNFQLKAIAFWVFIFIVVHYMFQNSTSISTQTALRTTGFDAVVFIAMGVVTNDPMIDLSIESVRSTGNYKGDIYLITDRPNCFADAVATHNVKIILTEPRDSIIKIKAMKPEIFSFLPKHIDNVLYLDIDILVSRDLGSFTRDATLAVASIQAVSAVAAAAGSNSSSKFLYDMAAFLDAKGHYVGFCSGCEKWHTGVLLLHRGHGVECLKEWRTILLSGKFDTDQESLDEAERLGSCQHLVNFPSRHLLFAKDYIGWLLTSGHSFVHITSAARIETQDYFYREMVVPRIWRSISTTALAKMATKKVCAASSPLPV